MARKKRYSSVREMVRDLSEDKTFADEFDEQVSRRELVKALFVLRCSADLSQKDVAGRMGCTQSRVSKLESGIDDDLRLGDLQAYAAALGLETRIVLARKGRTLVDDVKYHAFSIKRLLEHLAELVGDDGSMAKGVLGFFSEAAFNLAKFIQGAADKLNQPQRVAPPHISLEIQDVSGEQPADAGDNASAYFSRGRRVLQGQAPGKGVGS